MADPAFIGAGEKAGYELWRIEDLKPVKMGTEALGTFHKGDSYILLATTIADGGKKNLNLHFWQGSESSQDEKGVAAYKSVELDDQLGGRAVQYRELEGSETSLFLSYFESKGGIQYKAGGVASGFKHVDRDAYETRLLHLKGRRTVRVSEVPVTSASLNSGDVFILDQGLSIYVYEGASANRLEKQKGAQVARFIKDDERAGKAKVFRVQDDPEAAGDFWAALGGEPASLPEGESDDVVPAPPAARLRAVGADADADLSGGLKKELLSSDRVFLLSSNGEAFIWVGKKASLEEKKAAMDAMTTFLADPSTNTPNASVARVSEGVESGAFKSHFMLWQDPIRKMWGSTKPKVVQEDQDVDFDKLLAHAQNDDLNPGTDGTVKVWRIENLQKVEWPENKYGQFFGGDSFLVLYSYKDTRGKDCFIIYFWQGLTCSADERGMSALLAKEMDDALGGSPTQVRVVQGQEPAHFRSLFKGKMVVHSGGIPSGFNNSTEADTTDQDGVALFQVRGTGPMNATAAQVAETASSLNSGDCFVLVSPGTVFVWNGEGSSDGERETAQSIANDLAADYLNQSGRAVVVLAEGSEDEAFWDTLGGKGEYAKESFQGGLPRDPRLFQLSTETGSFRVNEVAGFSQSSLIDEDVMLLDTYSQLFLWVGDGATKEEKTKSADFAKMYITNAAAKDGRSTDVPVVTVTAGDEPMIFTCHFLAWDSSRSTIFVDPYEKKIAAQKAAKEARFTAAITSPSPNANDGAADDDEIARPTAWKTNNDPEARAAAVRKAEEERMKRLSVSANMDVVANPPPIPAVSTKEYDDPTAKSYSQDELKTKLPQVDPARKEQYLSDADFQELFKTDKASFLGLPKWKQANAKKMHGLF